MLRNWSVVIIDSKGQTWDLDTGCFLLSSTENVKDTGCPFPSSTHIDPVKLFIYFLNQGRIF